MTSDRSPVDPCPDVPPGPLDVLTVPILAKQLGRVAAGGAGGRAEAGPAARAAAAPREGPSCEPPEVGHRQVVGSCRPWSGFAPLVAQAARAAGFRRARRKAFVADGAANNWRLRERCFGPSVAVPDFIHALGYVYAAATAGRPSEQGWGCYRKWISWAWKGEVRRVIAELQRRQEEVGRPGKDESETSVASVVARALSYLSHHQDEASCAEHRQEGLPITSSVMGSVVKQMNYRVKGSEKFWCSQGAEAVVRLRAGHLSDGAPLDEFFRQRQAQASGQRPYRRAA